MLEIVESLTYQPSAFVYPEPENRYLLPLQDVGATAEVVANASVELLAPLTVTVTVSVEVARADPVADFDEMLSAPQLTLICPLPEVDPLSESDVGAVA